MRNTPFVIIVLFSLLSVSAFAQKKAVAKTDSTLILREFAGTYAITGSSDFSAVIVTFTNNKLMGKADVQSAFNELRPTPTPDKFSISSAEGFAEITFLRDDKKKVTGMKVYYGDQEVRGEKNQ